MKRSITQQSLFYIIICIATVISIYPIILMILSSFKSNIDVLQKPFSLPSSFSLENYKTLLDELPFFHYIVNSVVVSVVSVLLILLFSSLAAFYIARYNFKWNNGLFFIFLMGMMIPIKLGIVPLFMLMKNCI